LRDEMNALDDRTGINCRSYPRTSPMGCPKHSFCVLSGLLCRFSSFRRSKKPSPPSAGQMLIQRL
jgi:hypothetical protein